MKKSILYFLIGTLISFCANYFLLGGEIWQQELYHSSAFGLGWGLAYYVDRPDWALPKKMAISLVGILLLLSIGFGLFSFEIAVPSVIKFSTIFVVYYLLASFKTSKSLRQ